MTISAKSTKATSQFSSLNNNIGKSKKQRTSDGEKVKKFHDWNKTETEAKSQCASNIGWKMARYSLELDAQMNKYLQKLPMISSIA